MSHSTGFPPVARKDARILILGSMPGDKSLQEQQYYAHPRNAFWPIMYELLGAHEELSYQQRKRLLIKHHIALWDVLKSCYRRGSLDASIDHGTIEANRFDLFFSKHTKINTVFFNGSAAENLFRKYVLKEMELPKLEYHRLPSTSPAHAAMSKEQKLKHWQMITDYLNNA